MYKLKKLALAAYANQKIRYLCVGFYNTLFGYSAFAMLLYIFPRFHYIFILITAHFILVINAFFGYRLLVFKSKKNVGIQFVKFNAVYLGTLFFNIVLLSLFIEICRFNMYFGQFISMLISIYLTYIIHIKYSFKN